MTDVDQPPSEEAPKNEQEQIRFQVRDLVASCVREAPGSPEEIVLDDAGVEVISEAVDKVLDTHVLMEVVDAILVIAHYLETEQSAPTVAKRLVEIVNREPVIDSMKRINEDRHAGDSEKARDAAEAFAKLTKQRVSILMTAPSVDEKDPEGTVKLASLDFPKRM